MAENVNVMDIGNYKFEIENLKCEFLPLTAREGLQVSENFMSCMNISANSENNSIDIGKFSKLSMEIILHKLVVIYNNKRESIDNVDSLGLYFKSPLVSIEIVTQFIQYLTPFFHSLKGLNNMAKSQK